MRRFKSWPSRERTARMFARRIAAGLCRRCALPNDRAARVVCSACALRAKLKLAGVAI